MKYPAVLVNYRFTGFLDEIYATLVVRLHHTEPFQQNQLSRSAADFKTNTGKQLGVKLTRRAPDVGELEVYFDPAAAMEEKIISGEPEQGTRAGGRGHLHRGAGGPDQPGVQCQRSSNRQTRQIRERRNRLRPLFGIRSIFAWFAWFAVTVVTSVLLVIRNAEGEVRWMEVRDLLKRASDSGRNPVKQIVFAGERFDVMSVRGWRERVLGGKTAD